MARLLHSRLQIVLARIHTRAGHQRQQELVISQLFVTLNLVPKCAQASVRISLSE